MKKKTLVLAVCMAFATPAVSVAKALPSDIVGLNLGEIKSSSYLDEPFKGIIPILFTSNEHASQLKAKLAPASIFSQLGAERLPELENINFEVSILNNKPVIVVSSTNAIHLPFLNLVLEIESSAGSIYQDYTVMLDPRGYHAGQNTTPNSQKIIPPKTYSSSVSNRAKTHYTIIAGDSLSKIAHELKTRGVSLSKMMEGIHLKNPSAFVDNDINKIRKGVVLNLPTSNELRNFDLITQVEKTDSVNTLNDSKSVSDSKTSSSDNANSNTYTVRSGDTLSKITKKFSHEGVSFTKMMKTIHSNNPHAFSKNRINLLKVNAILSIPSVDEVSVNTRITKNVKTKVTPSVKETRNSAQKNITTQEKTSQVSTAKTDINLIKQLKDVNTEVVGSLEKRVRELRGELSQATTNYSNLESSLNKKELLLLKQQHEVKKLKNMIKDLQVANSTINPEAVSASKISETFQPEVDTSKVETEQTETNNISYIPENAGNKIESLIGSQTESNSMSFKDLSYTALALILGLLLIRYRKELYSYSSISYDHPKFYSENEDDDEYNEIPDFRDTLVISDTDIVTDSALDNTSEDESLISEENIQECELLVDELLDDLEEKPEVNHVKEEIIESLSENDFDSFDIENDDTETTNYLYQENTTDIEISDNNEIKEEILNELSEKSSDISLNENPESISFANNDLQFGFKSLNVDDSNAPESFSKENITKTEINDSDELMVEILNELGEKPGQEALNEKSKPILTPPESNNLLFDVEPFERKMDSLINLTKTDSDTEESYTPIVDNNEAPTIKHENTSMMS